MPFVPGKSGNPGGRPRLMQQIRRLAQADSEDAYRRVRELMDSDNGKIALAAAIAILKVAGVPMTPEHQEPLPQPPSADVTTATPAELMDGLGPEEPLN